MLELAIAEAGGALVESVGAIGETGEAAATTAAWSKGDFDASG